MAHFLSSNRPSSGSTGFFQQAPKLRNQMHEDEALRRSISLFLSSPVLEVVTPDLERFGEQVLSKQVMDWISDAERSIPFLKGSGYDSFGRRTDELVMAEGWKQLQAMGIREGIVAKGYLLPYGPYNRLVQFLKCHLWSASSAFVTCPSAMQDGAASVISGQLARVDLDLQTRKVLSSAYERLVSYDPTKAWTSGQWMTERAGGSDVSGTETVATLIGATNESTSVDGQPLGKWSVDGFKWFSSATDSQMAVLLARSPEGLSCFFAPTRRLSSNSGTSELNGIRIQRLKSKLGTRALPTAELELCGMRAWLLGEEGNGVKVISRMLNITRLHNAVTSMSLLGRGLAISKAYASLRTLSNNRLLRDVPLFANTIAKIVLDYRANMHFTFFVAYLLGVVEHPDSLTTKHSLSCSNLIPQSSEDSQTLLRLLTPVLKARTAKLSIYGLQECMESLGGLGYLENEETQEINISRLYRDANVLSIWEGTTDVMATVVINVLKGSAASKAVSVLDSWFVAALQTDSAPIQSAEISAIQSVYQSFKAQLLASPTKEILGEGRQMIGDLGNLVCAVLLVVDAARDNNALSWELCKRFIRTRVLGNGRQTRLEKALEWDQKIAFDQPHKHKAGGGSRL